MYTVYWVLPDVLKWLKSLAFDKGSFWTKSFWRDFVWKNGNRTSSERTQSITFRRGRIICPVGRDCLSLDWVPVDRVATLCASVNTGSPVKGAGVLPHFFYGTIEAGFGDWDKTFAVPSGWNGGMSSQLLKILWNKLSPSKICAGSKSFENNPAVSMFSRNCLGID